MSPGKSNPAREILNQGERLAMTCFWWGEAPELPERLSKAHEAVPLYSRKAEKLLSHGSTCGQLYHEREVGDIIKLQKIVLLISIKKHNILML
jgi:hypothetical protein